MANVDVPDKPRDPPDDLSQQAHRRVIGGLGLFLPILVWALAGVRPTEGLVPWAILGSVSAYYHTGAAGVFVGIVFALSLFLFTYRGYKGVRADRIVGTAGGVAGLLVALFPTTAPHPLRAPGWWSPTTAMIHYIGAVALFGSFILFAVWLFRQSNIPKRRDRPPEKRRRDDVCLICGVVMIVCLIWAAVIGPTDASIFWPESIAIEAFAVSWLVKSETHRTLAAAVKRAVAS